MDYSAEQPETFHEIYTKMGLLGSMHIDLTYECPLNCVHCYAKGSDFLHPAVMDTDMVRDIISQAAELGALNITFSGGEPLLRKDIWELIAYARSLHFIVRLKTSGIYLTGENIEFISKLGMVFVDVSLHGPRASVHDAVTRVAGSFDLAMNAIKALYNANIPIQVNTSALKLNVDDISELKSYFDEMGIKESIGTSIIPSETRGTEPLSYSLGHDEFVQIFTILLKDGNNHLPKTTGYDLSSPICYAGRSSLYATPDGLVYPCVTWPELAGNLKKQSLRDIWFDSPVFKRIRNQFHSDRKKCVGCNLFGYCKFCPGRAFQAMGNAVMPYPDACSTAQWTREAYAKHFGSAPDSPGQGPKNR